MGYRVRLTRRALGDLSGIYGSVGAQTSDAAFRWYCGLKDVIYTLRGNPNRCPVTPEARELRHLLYGNKPHVYRVIYRVLENQSLVEVLHIRHGARQAFKPDDLG